MNILVVAAHPDDEVLGCGGSIAKWSKEGHNVHVVVLAEGVTSRDPIRNRRGRSEELLMLKKAVYGAAEILEVKSTQLFDLPDNRMDSVDLVDVVKIIESEMARVSPEMVLTHHAGDLNIDHRITHDAVVTACRPHPEQCVKRLQSFEVPSSTEWQATGTAPGFQPNCYVDITKTLEQKLRALEVYESEMRDWPHSRSAKATEYLARWRGASVGCESAEAFQLLREII